MSKASVALLLAFALALAITPSMATAESWQTVETWGDTLKTPTWENVEIWTTYTNVTYVVGKPILVSPDNNSTISDNTPTFNWIAGANASSQRFLLDDDAAFSSPIENVLCGGAAMNYTIATPLTDDNYWWKVVAILVGIENSSGVHKFTLYSPPTEDWQTVETWGDILKSRGWENVEIWTTYLPTVEIGDYPAKGADYLHSGVANIVDDPPFEFLWKKNILGTYDEFSGPIVVDGKVWIANKGDNIFRCLSLNSGTEIWSYQLNAETDGAPLWFDDKIYVGTGNGAASLYCFNADNGDNLWRYDGASYGFTSTPWVKPGCDLLTLEDFENIDDWTVENAPVALSTAWKTEGTYSMQLGTTGSSQFAVASKVLDFSCFDNLTFDYSTNFDQTDQEFRVYVDNNLIYRVWYENDEWQNPLSGAKTVNVSNYFGNRKLWFRSTSWGAISYVDYLRAVGSQIVYWVDGRYLYALDADTGNLIWSDDLGAGDHPFVGVYYEGITYTPGKNGAFLISAYNAATGNYLWGINGGVWDSGITVDTSDPDNIRLYVAQSNPAQVWNINPKTGENYWVKTIYSGDIGRYMLGVPAVWENKIYVTSGDRVGNQGVYCLHAENGEIKWSWAGPGTATVYSSVTVLPSGKVIFVTNQGVVRIHDAYTGATIWTYQLTEASYGGHVAVVEGAFLLVSDRHLWAFGSGVGYEWQTVETWGDFLEIEEEEEPPPPPPPDYVPWAVFVIRFLSIFGPFGFVAWNFTKIKDPASGARAAVWVGVGFIALVVLWFVVDAVEAILYAI